MMATNEYVEVHNGGYYFAGTRVGLDVVTCDFRRGRSGESIFRSLSINRFSSEGLRRHCFHPGAPHRRYFRRDQGPIFRGGGHGPAF